jgi:dihydroneopterin aldolase
MDKIIIEELQVYAHHGVAEQEKQIGQMFVVSLELGLDLSPASHSDDLHQTVSYAAVCDEVQAVLQRRSYNLIEAAAEQVIGQLFEAFPRIERIKIRLEKPWAPMGHHLRYAAVELERAREASDAWL